jgi:TCP-1/cpn60 chaperonin family
MSSMVAEKSNQHQHAIQKYLKMNHYSSDTSNPPSGGQLSSNNLNISQSSAIFNNGFSNLESRNSTKLDQMFESHLENMVSIIIRESEIDTKKWKSIIYAFVR